MAKETFIKLTVQLLFPHLHCPEARRSPNSTLHKIRNFCTRDTQVARLAIKTSAPSWAGTKSRRKTGRERRPTGFLFANFLTSNAGNGLRQIKPNGHKSNMGISNKKDAVSTLEDCAQRDSQPRWFVKGSVPNPAGVYMSLGFQQPFYYRCFTTKPKLAQLNYET